VQQNCIFKGEQVDVLTTNLSEFHGYYGSETYVGSLGGQVQ